MTKAVFTIICSTLMSACATTYQPTFDGPTATLKTFYQGIIFSNQNNCSKGEYFNYASSSFDPQIIKIPANKMNTFWFVGTPPYGNNICQIVVEFHANANEQYTPLFQSPANTDSHSCTMAIFDSHNQPVNYRIRQLKTFRLGKYTPYCYPLAKGHL
ncbi:hypothetical protein [Spartinivicinus poritis]|uniref:Lipoprotein n=1 Tax=Spartinivicinus poritis TaxID=2994640 RepID=A0ABT5U8N6_9GAMM|nr:hypothetical protein [Spartinivicinus sp. A2-2]MDE1462715.1 hypothetical protein [Spartinivicinus sp. A2-2]